MPRKLHNLLNVLKAAAEPTRLRVLAVLSHGELTVGEITQILGQSQPRISRHLKVLGDAGLLERFREEHCVYYRVPNATDPASGLHELLDPEDPEIKADQRRRETVVADRARRATDRLSEQARVDEFRDSLGATVGSLLTEEMGAEPVGNLLDIGTGAGHLLKAMAPHATQAVGVDISSDALRLARTHLHGAGFRRCVFRHGDMYRLPCADNEFDTVTLGRILSHAEDPGAVLAEATRVLRPGGRLVLIDDFDVLATVTAGNPLATVRAWLQAAGLTCERLRPIDTESSHVLFTLARRPAKIEEAA